MTAKDIQAKLQAIANELSVLAHGECNDNAAALLRLCDELHMAKHELSTLPHYFPDTPLRRRYG